MYTISKFAIYKHTKKNSNTKNHSSSSSEKFRNISPFKFAKKENKQTNSKPQKKMCVCLTKKRIGNGKRRGGGLGKNKEEIYKYKDE